MKKLLISLFIVTTLFMVGCTKDNKKGIEFKESYERLNGTTNKSGKEHRSVTIDENNPFVITTPEEVVKMLDNKETFYLYVGDPLCPWCRSTIEKATEIAISKKVDKVYSIEIWDDEGKEILRDKYEMVDGKLTQTIKGTDAYNKMLESFKELLSDYNLTVDGKTVPTGEKRIYAPNYFYIENGVAKKLISGTSELQKDSREELTKEMLEDEEKQFNEFFELKK